MGTALTTPAAPPPLDARGQPLLPFAFSHPSGRQVEVTDPGTGSVLFTFCKPKWFGTEWRLYEGRPPAPQGGAADERHLLQVERHLLQVEPQGLFCGRKRITAGPAARSGASESPIVTELLRARRGWAFQYGGDGFLWREPRGRSERKAHRGYRRWLLCFRTPGGGGGGGAEDAWPELVGALKVAVPSRRFHPHGSLWLAADVATPGGAKGAAGGLAELLVTAGIAALQAMIRSRNSG